ncbi:hypothetical protein JD844_031301 [Phrynosoma platyrhinos]|uniref:Uncharacterized protein n=1 Tax=Phrynosoma platyrhinos TaxID=52577 RepID=A0ABQ7T132_PHRPL|nr:hypothetical protein JD844_031301 [Phrynosoma platyrhinos]
MILGKIRVSEYVVCNHWFHFTSDDKGLSFPDANQSRPLEQVILPDSELKSGSMTYPDCVAYGDLGHCRSYASSHILLFLDWACMSDLMNYPARTTAATQPSQVGIQDPGSGNFPIMNGSKDQVMEELTMQNRENKSPKAWK